MISKKDTILLWMPAYLGFHSMAWRQEAQARAVEMDFAMMRRQIQTAERGKFHGAFLPTQWRSGSIPPTSPWKR